MVTVQIHISASVAPCTTECANMFMLFVAFFVNQAIASGFAGILPHPDCIYDSSQILFCGRSYVRLPSTFDVDKIPPDISKLYFVCSSPTDYYCTIIEDDFQPVPSRINLTTVMIEGMRSTTQRRIPVSRLLHNVKTKLRHLIIMYSKIEYLDAEFLDGFTGLTHLELPMNDIADIHVGTFFPLLFQPVEVIFAADQVSVYDGLRILDLSHNKIEAFDWSVIQPVSNTLEGLYLSNQAPKLRTIHHSGATFENVLRDIRLDGNNLSYIPELVLKSIRSYPRTVLNFAGNAFCPNHPDCSCCELKDLAIRMHTLVKTVPTASVLLSCGSGPQLSVYANATLPALAVYSNCEDTHTTPRLCKTAPPVTITCEKGHMTFSETNFDKTDSTRIVLRGDTTQHCRMVIHDAFQNLVDVATLRSRKRSSALLDRELVEAQCYSGTVRLDAHSEYFDEDEEDFDTDHFTARKLTFESDTSHACRTQFTAFLRSLFELSTSAVESFPTILVPVNKWLRTSLICSDEPPLQATCHKGVVQFPYGNVQWSKALRLAIKTDGSHFCRSILFEVHSHVTRHRSSVMIPEEENGLGNTLVAVCQQGLLVTSDPDGQRSAVSDFEFYSAPNQLCTEAFNDVLDIVISYSKRS